MDKNTMIEQTLAEWQAEMISRFNSSAEVAFVCPACGHVATVQDYLDAGGDIDDAPQECIGRLNGKGTKNQTDLGDGCNWAAYGLFGTLGKGRKITLPDGTTGEVFDFAPTEVA